MHFVTVSEYFSIKDYMDLIRWKSCLSLFCLSASRRFSGSEAAQPGAWCAGCECPLTGAAPSLRPSRRRQPPPPAKELYGGDEDMQTYSSHFSVVFKIAKSAFAWTPLTAKTYFRVCCCIWHRQAHISAQKGHFRLCPESSLLSQFLLGPITTETSSRGKSAQQENFCKTFDMLHACCSTEP